MEEEEEVEEGGEEVSARAPDAVKRAEGIVCVIKVLLLVGGRSWVKACTVVVVMMATKGSRRSRQEE